MKQKTLQIAAALFAALGFAPQAFADTDILTAEQGYQKITNMPENLGDYYFIIVDKDKDLMMTQGAANKQRSTDVDKYIYKAAWYMPSADPATDLSRVWTVEANNHGDTAGYGLRGALRPSHLMQPEGYNGAWAFRTKDITTTPNEWAQYLLAYNEEGEYWTIQNARYTNDGYVGPWNDVIEAGAEMAGNKQDAAMGRFLFYAITKGDFYLAKIANVYESLLNYSVADGKAEAAYQEAIATAKNAVEAAENNVESLDAALADLEEARQTYAKAAMPANGKALDVSFLMADAAVTGTASDWKPNWVVNNQQQYVGAPDDVFLNGGGSQTITGLRAGVYRLTAATRAQNANGASIALNGATATIGNVGDTGNALCNGWGWTTTSSVVVEKGGSLDISFSATNGWANADNFKLEYLGQMVENVSLTVSEAGWATLMLPYAAELPEGLAAYTCAGTEDGNEDGESALVLAEASSLAPNTPYIIQGTPATYTFQGSGMIEQYQYTDGLLTGTYVQMPAVVGSYVLQNPEETGIGFYKVVEVIPTVGAFRAYMNAESADAAGINVSRLILGDDDVTGIESALAGDGDARVDVYSLSGILVRKGVAKNEALNGLQKGIYVVDGVKKAVK